MIGLLKMTDKLRSAIILKIPIIKLDTMITIKLLMEIEIDPFLFLTLVINLALSDIYNPKLVGTMAEEEAETAAIIDNQHLRTTSMSITY